MGFNSGLKGLNSVYLIFAYNYSLIFVAIHPDMFTAYDSIKKLTFAIYDLLLLCIYALLYTCCQ
jgi:hypothetical protein